MNYKSFIAFFSVTLTGICCLAQSTPTAVAEDFIPASTNQSGKQYPKVNSERRVRASFTASGAQKVQLDIGGEKYDMLKDEKGVWTGESLMCLFSFTVQAQRNVNLYPGKIQEGGPGFEFGNPG